jgi:uncharacterized protein
MKTNLIFPLEWKLLWVLFLFVSVVLPFAGCSKNLEKRGTYYNNGQPKEQWTVLRDSSDNYIGQGKYVAWYENGQKKQEENWIGGRLEGRFITWHDNGIKHQDGTYLHGQMEGKYEEWDPDGQKIIDGRMLSGKQHGKWTYYNEKGNIIKQEDYTNGELSK